MRKILPADKDAYIVNKIVNSKPAVSSNTGIAATLDLYKLYGQHSSGSSYVSKEYSRAFIHFDLSELRKDVNSGKLDINDDSFWCKIQLKDVYGGQPTPQNFSLEIYPLSASFDEGLGKDVSKYSDYDVCNWLSSSTGTSWFISGCSLAVDALTPGDYITSSLSNPSTKLSSNFKTGEEDLYVDVTKIISSTLTGELPDQGFRISFSEELENDSNSYFVKRFSSRHAYNEDKRPKLVYGFDDSIIDDSLNLVFDNDCRINLYNYIQGQLTNIVSNSQGISGSNCLLLKIEAKGISGSYSTYFTGSQVSRGVNFLTGVYSALINVPSTNSSIKTSLVKSGSVTFDSYWMSLDESVTYSTGSSLVIRNPVRTTKNLSTGKFFVNVTNVKDVYTKDEIANLRVNIQDYNDPYIKVAKVPVELPGTVLKNVYYSIRDNVTNEEIIPFDIEKNSTRVSSDSVGMFFDLPISSLVPGRTYVVDIMLSINGSNIKHRSASPAFTIDKLVT